MFIELLLHLLRCYEKYGLLCEIYVRPIGNKEIWANLNQTFLWETKYIQMKIIKLTFSKSALFYLQHLLRIHSLRYR